MASFPPKKNTAFTWRFFIRDADGDLVAGAAGLDVEVSGDGAVFADVAGTEVDEGEGAYSVPVTAGEMNFDQVQLICKTSTGGAKSAAITIYTVTDQIDDLSKAADVGLLADTAAVGDPTSADTLMQYIKQLINLLIGADGAGVFPAEQAPANAINLFEVIRAIHADVTGLAGAAMRGTDSVDTAAMRGTDGVDTATMRGTDAAALAADMGLLADAAADGDPTATDTMMKYIKQLVNVLVGSTGIVSFPAAVDPPANNVNLAEVIRAIRDDVTGLAGSVMRGTDSVDTAAMRGTDSAALAVNLPDILSLANINNEVLDVMNVDTIPELSVGIPAATPTHREAIMLMYMALRNKIDISNTIMEVHNDAGVIIATKALTESAGVFSEAEMISG